MGLKYHPLNLVSCHFGSLTLHPATYSSLLKFNHERRIRSSTLTSLCHGQLCTERFCFSTPKATACQKPHSVQLVPKCLFLGLSTLGALSAWHRAKPAACAPPMSWGKDRRGAQPCSAPPMAPCGCLRLAAIHPTSFSSHRAETKDSLSAFKIVAVHCKTKYFFPNDIRINLTWNFKTQGQLPHAPALHSHDLNVFSFFHLH